MKKYFNFDNSYVNLPEIMYSVVNPVPVKNPELFIFNWEYADEIGVFEGAREDEIVDILSGNTLAEGSVPISQAYCGHQFGYLNELGDGRASLLGEHLGKKGERIDVQLKGSGKTRYAGRGDGRANLGPMIKEYLFSEAMNKLNIKSTRSLAVLKTGEKVHRGALLDGAILARTASSHIRVGTFQFAAVQRDEELLRKLADYTIHRHYPHLEKKEEKYLELFKDIVKAQIDLIVDWMRVGFVHGVLNTDNVSIAGEGIDYGPCAFMDSYNTGTVFSSIDVYGRYSYGNQPTISGWNMARLAEAFIPLILISEKEKRSKNFDRTSLDDELSLEILNGELKNFLRDYNTKYLSMMAGKLGFKALEGDDEELLGVLLNMMQFFAFDYTNTFIYLRSLIKPLNFNGDLLLPKNRQARELFKTWTEEWLHRIENKNLTRTQVIREMERVNPILIPRNYMVDRAIKAGEEGDRNDFDKLLLNLSKPYDYNFSDLEYIIAKETNRPFVTYCGT